MTTKRLALVLLAVLVSLAALAATAHAKIYGVPASLGSTLNSTRDETGLAILLPNRIALDFDGNVHASGGGDARSYSLSLAARPDCGGANACFLVTFSAERGGAPGGDRRVRLRGGRIGHFTPLSCGASCSPPSIQWSQRGNLYTIQARVPDRTDGGQRRRLIAAADAAISAGPR